MAIYEYRCEYCGETREYRFNMGEAPATMTDEYDYCPDKPASVKQETPGHRFVRVLSLFHGTFGDTKKFHN